MGGVFDMVSFKLFSLRIQSHECLWEFSGNVLEKLKYKKGSVSKARLVGGINFGTWLVKFDSSKDQFCVKIMQTLNPITTVKDFDLTKYFMLHEIKVYEALLPYKSDSMVFPIWYQKEDPIMVFPYYERGDFFDYLGVILDKVPQMSFEWDLRVGLQLIRGLKFLHDHQIVHLDVKYENVLIEECDGKLRLKFIDFESAKVCKEGEERVTSLGVGTQIYKAPECKEFVLRVSKNKDRKTDLDLERGYPYSQASDIYSLGLILFYLRNLSLGMDCLSVNIQNILLNSFTCVCSSLESNSMNTDIYCKPKNLPESSHLDGLLPSNWEDALYLNVKDRVKSKIQLNQMRQWLFLLISMTSKEPLRRPDASAVEKTVLSILSMNPSLHSSTK